MATFNGINNITLKNGFRFVIAQKKSSGVVSMIVLVKAGSRHEPNNLQGMSHLLEHLLFRGSKRFPKSEEISELFDKLGAKFNAIAEKDYTGYHIKVDRKKYLKALEILADFTQKPLLRSSDIKQEKAIVLAELEQRNDDPQQLTLFEFTDRIFAGHPLRKNVGGNSRSVKATTRKNLVDYHSKLYNHQNMILAIAGDLPEKTVVAEVTKLFSGKSKTFEPPIKLIPFPPTKSKGPRIYTRKRKLNQDHIVLGFPLFGSVSNGSKFTHNKQLYPIELLSKILGELASSRLFHEVRDKRGLVYQIKSEVKLFQEGGYFAIQFSSDKKNTEKALNLIFNELNKIKRNGVTQAEFHKAKENIKSATILRKENTLKMAVFYGLQMLYNLQPISFKVHLDNFADVKRGEIKKIAQEAFRKENLVLVLAGSTTKQKINSIIQNK